MDQLLRKFMKYFFKEKTRSRITDREEQCRLFTQVEVDIIDFSFLVLFGVVDESQPSVSTMENWVIYNRDADGDTTIIYHIMFIIHFQSIPAISSYFRSNGQPVIL